MLRYNKVTNQSFVSKEADGQQKSSLSRGLIFMQSILNQKPDVEQQLINHSLQDSMLSSAAESTTMSSASSTNSEATVGTSSTGRRGSLSPCCDCTNNNNKPPVIWRPHADQLMEGYTSLYNSLVVLVDLRTEQIRQLHMHIAIAQRGMPALPEHQQELDFNDNLTNQWTTISKIAQKCEKIRKRRRKPLPAPLSQLEEMIDARRQELDGQLTVLTKMYDELDQLTDKNEIELSLLPTM